MAGHTVVSYIGRRTSDKVVFIGRDRVQGLAGSAGPGFRQISGFRVRPGRFFKNWIWIFGLKGFGYCCLADTKMRRIPRWTMDLPTLSGKVTIKLIPR